MLLGDIYLPQPLGGPLGPPLFPGGPSGPPEVLGDIYHLKALVETHISYEIKLSLFLPYPPSKG